MNGWTQVSYTYDGSFAGFLTCMDESFQHFEEPMAFQGPEEDRTSLYPERVVPTDENRAKRFYRQLRQKVSKEAQTLVAHAFLTCMPDRECAIWQFLKFAQTIGPGVTYWIADDRVNRLNKAVQKKPGAAPAAAPLLPAVPGGDVPHLRQHPPRGAALR